MSRVNRKGAIASFAAVSALAAIVASGPAKAATVYTLTDANIAAPAPYGTATVTLVDANTAHVVFTSNTANGIFFTDGGSAGVNTNGDATVSNITGNALPGGPCAAGGNACYSDAGSGNEDGFGVFSDRIDTTDSFSNRSSTIAFDLDLTSGTWASDSVVLAANASGNFVAAHIGVCNNTSCTAFSLTGFATDGVTPPPPVPEPASLVILGTALVAFGYARRRGRKKI